MTRPELWGVIDRIARAHPPGAIRMSNAEVADWLNLLAASASCGRDTRRDAKAAAKWVPKLIGPVYEMPCCYRPAEPEPEMPAGPKRSYQPTLFDEVTP